MGLISSLFNVALPRDVLFHQLLQLQCLYHGYLPLFSFVLHTTAFVVVLLWGFREDLVTAVIAEVFITLFFCLDCSVKC